MRKTWVDVARGLGIILVVYGHVLRGLEAAGLPINPSYFLASDRILYSFHMPLFFVLSGYFFEASIRKNVLSSFIKSKIGTLLYPYLLWSFIQTSVEVLLSRYTNGKTEIQELLYILYSPRAQFWFLIALFNISVLSALFYYLTPKQYILIISGVWVIYKLINNYWGFYSNFLEYFIFFIAGILMNRCKADKYFLKPLVVLLLVVTTSLLFSVYLFNYPSLLVKFFLGILGTFVVIAISVHINSHDHHWLAYLGQKSLPIYLVHILAGSGTRIVLYKFFGVNNIISHIVIGILIGIIVPLLIYRISVRTSLKILFYLPTR